MAVGVGVMVPLVVGGAMGIGVTLPQLVGVGVAVSVIDEAVAVISATCEVSTFPYGGAPSSRSLTRKARRIPLVVFGATAGNRIGMNPARTLVIERWTMFELIVSNTVT